MTKKEKSKKEEELKSQEKIHETKSSEEKGTGEKLVKEAGEKADLPPFPPEVKSKKSLFSPSISEDAEGEPDFESIDIEEFCKDIANIPFEIWHILKPDIKPLSAQEKKLIGKPLSRVVAKYELQKYAKDEFVLIAFLSFSVLSRLKKKEDSSEREIT